MFSSDQIRPILVEHSESIIMERDGYWYAFDVPANSPMPHRFPDMTGYFNTRSAGHCRKQYGGIIYIIRDEIVRLRKMLSHSPDDGGQCVLCSGAVRPFSVAVRLADGNGNHQYLSEQ